MNRDDQSDDDAPSLDRAAMREDIEATRSRMDDTLEELGTRLNPGRIKQHAKDSVREATIGRMQTMARNTMDKATAAGRNLTDLVRDNPIPAALIAVGIGWLVVGSRRRTVSLSTSPTDTAKDVAHKAVDRASHVASNVANELTEAGRTQSVRVEHAFNENPLAIGAVALVLGAAAGLLVPSTRREAELLGEKRDEFLERASEVIHEKKDQLGRVARRVTAEAKSEATKAAREEGLSGSR